MKAINRFRDGTCSTRANPWLTPLVLATTASFVVASVLTAAAQVQGRRSALTPPNGPASDPADPTVWPNQISRANSDPWLVANHDKIRRMRPRLLLVNFSNEHDSAHLMALTNRIIAALKESSRDHGYRDPAAPPFLEYQILKAIDLRDPDRHIGNSRRFPYKDKNEKSGFNTSYRDFFSDEFADYYQIPDPDNPSRYLTLQQLVDRGYVHELWFFTSGSTAPGDPTDGAYEVVEEKPAYDLQFARIPDRFVQAGNGGDADQPWTGRSLRIGCVNASRGPGCFLESLAHGVEGNANSNAIPYFTRYFNEFAGFDLDKRYGLPFNSLYAANFGDSPIQYPRPDTMIVVHSGKTHTVENYRAVGGNVHFTPNGRSHYDLASPHPVLSTIETWRTDNPVPKPWTIQAFDRYRTVDDCMGPWLVYWRQNFPGLDNTATDDEGKPMKNWWPFLFY